MTPSYVRTIACPVNPSSPRMTSMTCFLTQVFRFCSLATKTRSPTSIGSVSLNHLMRLVMVGKYSRTHLVQNPSKACLIKLQLLRKQSDDGVGSTGDCFTPFELPNKKWGGGDSDIVQPRQKIYPPLPIVENCIIYLVVPTATTAPKILDNYLSLNHECSEKSQEVIQAHYDLQSLSLRWTNGSI